MYRSTVQSVEEKNNGSHESRNPPDTDHTPSGQQRTNQEDPYPLDYVHLTGRGHNPTLSVSQENEEGQGKYISRQVRVNE